MSNYTKHCRKLSKCNMKRNAKAPPTSRSRVFHPPLAIRVVRPTSPPLALHQINQLGREAEVALVRLDQVVILIPLHLIGVLVAVGVDGSGVRRRAGVGVVVPRLALASGDGGRAAVGGGGGLKAIGGIRTARSQT